MRVLKGFRDGCQVGEDSGLSWLKCLEPIEVLGAKGLEFLVEECDEVYGCVEQRLRRHGTE